MPTICNTCHGTGIVKGLHNWGSGGTREERCWNCSPAIPKIPDLQELHNLLYTAQRQTTLDGYDRAISACRLTLARIRDAMQDESPTHVMVPRVPTDAMALAATKEALKHQPHTRPLNGMDVWPAMIAAAQETKPAMQYYYKKDGCPAKDTNDPACICWHDEGTGPFASTPEKVKSWRTKPAPSAAAAERRNTRTHELLSSFIGIVLNHQHKIGYTDNSPIAKEVAEAVEHLKDWPYPEPSPTPQADSQPAPQGETNVQLDIDSNPATPGQQRDVAGPVAVGQPVGHRSDQATGDPQAQGDNLLIVAERNIRSFLRSAVFKSESDREAALNCVDVLWEAARAPTDSVLEEATRYQWIAAHCSITSEHWSGRWSIVVEGPPPELQYSKDKFDAAIDAARKQGANHD